MVPGILVDLIRIPRSSPSGVRGRWAGTSDRPQRHLRAEERPHRAAVRTTCAIRKADADAVLAVRSSRYITRTGNSRLFVSGPLARYE